MWHWDSVMKAMKAALGHHRTACGFIFSTMKMEQKFDSHGMLNYILWGVIISTLVTSGFYIADLDLAAAVKY